MADFDPKAKERSAELREKMKRAPQKIARDPARMREAEREGIAPRVRNFVRQAEQERGREKGRAVEKGDGWSGKLGRMPRQPEQESEEQCGFPIPMSLLHATSHQ